MTLLVPERGAEGEKEKRFYPDRAYRGAGYYGRFGIVSQRHNSKVCQLLFIGS